MLARRTLPVPNPGLRLSRCTRCGVGAPKVYPFPLDATARNPGLCAKCQDEWDAFLLELASRWHQGLRFCFLCRRPLGDDLFPATSPFGPSCAECGISLAALAASELNPQ